MNQVKIMKKGTFKQFQFFKTPNSHFPHPHANHHINPLVWGLESRDPNVSFVWCVLNRTRWRMVCTLHPPWAGCLCWHLCWPSSWLEWTLLLGWLAGSRPTSPGMYSLVPKSTQDLGVLNPWLLVYSLAWPAINFNNQTYFRRESVSNLISLLFCQ